MHSRSAITAAAAVVGLALVLSGCQFSAKVGNLDTSTTTSADARPVLPKAAVEQKSADIMRPEAGGDPVSVSCPGDLPMEVGATLGCVITRADKQYELKVVVSQADPPNGAEFDATVGKLLGPAG